MDFQLDDQERGVIIPPPVSERRLVIAIDYGTTYTGLSKICLRAMCHCSILTKRVGVAIATPVGDKAKLNEIDIIHDWGPKMGNHDKIPSVISYSLRSQNLEHQWGTDLSPQAIAMVHTKLQLDVADTSSELDLILEGLDGMHNLDFQYIENSGGTPKYTHKGPEEIVEDYLTKVYDFLLVAVRNFTESLIIEIPVDIVATIPAVSYTGSLVRSH
jgi:molecular chaperone DnaK (HSP70)